MDKQVRDEFYNKLLLEDHRIKQDLNRVHEAKVEKMRSLERNPNQTTCSKEGIERLRNEIAFEKELRKEKRELSSAMKRMRNGTYGLCQQCGQEIPLNRIDRNPYTPLCNRCDQPFKQNKS